MSHFYGTVEGNRGAATRGGTKGSGLITTAAGWGGAIMVRVYHDKEGVDRYVITLGPWKGSEGAYKTIASGVLKALRAPVI